jgi:hypothetical protein
MVEFRNEGSTGWDLRLDVEPLSTDWTWRYMGLGQDRDERRVGLISRHERRYSTQKSVNGLHNHMDARTSRWMVVIMEYDMADNGRNNPNRMKKELIIKRKTRHIAPLQNKSIQTTNKPRGETSDTTSTASQGETWNTIAVLGLYY